MPPTVPAAMAADAAETVAEKVEGVAQNLSDFYKKREDNA